MRAYAFISINVTKIDVIKERRKRNLKLRATVLNGSNLLSSLSYDLSKIDRDY